MNTQSLMTREGATPDRPEARRPDRSRAVTSAAAMVGGILAVALVTGLVVQVAHPFIRHDDWGFSLSSDEPGSTDIWARNQYEGRWLTWVWWRVLGQHLSIVMATTVFVVAYSTWVVGTVRLLRLRRWWQQAAATTALLVSTTWIQLVYWPGTLSPSMVVAAVAVWTLPYARRRRSTWWPWLFLSVGLAVLSYQPVALLLLFAVAVTERRSGFLRLVRVAVGFAVAYAAGVLVVWTLNWWAFGVFGVTLAQWRQPNPLHSVADLVTNLGRYRTQLRSLASDLGPALVVGAVATVVGLWGRRTRRATGLVLVAGLMSVSVEAAVTVVTGAVTGVRASLWAWPLIVLPAALLAAARGPWVRRTGVVCLLGLTFVGILQWRSDLGEHRQTRDEYDALITQVAEARQRFPGLPVVLWMEPAIRKTARGNMTAVTLQNMTQEQQGVYPRWCSKARCAAIAATVTPPPRGEVVVADGAIVLRVPPPPRWL